MPIVKYKNQSGVVYAYDQTSVYDAQKKQSRPVRKYLGRVDPETGEIISTKGKRGRPKKQAGNSAGSEKDYKALYENVHMFIAMYTAPGTLCTYVHDHDHSVDVCVHMYMALIAVLCSRVPAYVHAS